jgi:hypothetical protein
MLTRFIPDTLIIAHFLYLSIIKEVGRGREEVGSGQWTGKKGSGEWGVGEEEECPQITRINTDKRRNRQWAVDREEGNGE